MNIESSALFIRRRVLSARGLFVLISAAFLTCARAEDFVVRLGVSLGAPQLENSRVIEPSIAALQKEFGFDRVRVVGMSSLEQALSEEVADLFISSSGLSRRMSRRGARDLVALVSDRFPNPNRSYGTLFIARSGSGISSFGDMKGKVLVTNSESGFSSHQIGMGEVSKRGYDPNDFFSKKLFVGDDLDAALKALFDGRADVASISSCYLEDKYPEGSNLRSKLVPIGVKSTHPCMASTDLYPNWTVSSMPSTDPEVARRAVIALLSMPKLEGGIKWSIATDLSGADELFKTLRVGPFAFLEDWLLEEYSPWIVLACAAGLILSGFSLLMSFLFRMKTVALMNSQRHELELEKSYAAANEKLAAMQKAIVISQMSSMIAHELRQPLTAIKAVAHGAFRHLDNGTFDRSRQRVVLEMIRQQADRAAEIVERVRVYARGRASPRSMINLSEALKRSCSLFEASSGFQGEIRLDLEEDVQMEGNSLEIELAVRNLLKNSQEVLALSGVKSPRICVDLHRTGEEIVVGVEDNGPEIDQEKLEVMRTPLNTSKREGTGLGLAIVASIAHAHNGRLSLEPGDGGGLRAELVFTCGSVGGIDESL